VIVASEVKGDQHAENCALFHVLLLVTFGYFYLWSGMIREILAVFFSLCEFRTATNGAIAAAAVLPVLLITLILLLLS